MESEIPTDWGRKHKLRQFLLKAWEEKYYQDVMNNYGKKELAERVAFHFTHGCMGIADYGTESLLQITCCGDWEAEGDTPYRVK